CSKTGSMAPAARSQQTQPKNSRNSSEFIQWKSEGFDSISSHSRRALRDLDAVGTFIAVQVVSIRISGNYLNFGEITKDGPCKEYASSSIKVGSIRPGRKSAIFPCARPEQPLAPARLRPAGRSIV